MPGSPYAKMKSCVQMVRMMMDSEVNHAQSCVLILKVAEYVRRKALDFCSIFCYTISTWSESKAVGRSWSVVRICFADPTAQQRSSYAVRYTKQCNYGKETLRR